MQSTYALRTTAIEAMAISALRSVAMQNQNSPLIGFRQYPPYHLNGTEQILDEESVEQTQAFSEWAP